MAIPEAGVGFREFIQDVGHAPSVHQHMVTGPDEITDLRTGADETQAEQRGSGEVEGVSPFVVTIPVQCLPLIVIVHVLPIQPVPGQAGGLDDHLMQVEFRVLDKGGAQRRVTCHDPGPCLLEGNFVEGADDTHPQLHDVGIGVRIGLSMK